MRIGFEESFAKGMSKTNRDFFGEKTKILFPKIISSNSKTSFPSGSATGDMVSSMIKLLPSIPAGLIFINLSPDAGEKMNTVAIWNMIAKVISNFEPDTKTFCKPIPVRLLK